MSERLIWGITGFSIGFGLGVSIFRVIQEILRDAVKPPKPKRRGGK